MWWVGRGPGKHTEEVEVQEDFVPRHENFPVPVLHRLQERTDRLRGLSYQLLKQNKLRQRRGELVSRPFILHPAYIF